MAQTSGNFDHGSNLSVGTTAVRLTTTDFKCIKGVLVRAPSTNTGNVYVGKSDVTAGTNANTDGMLLEPGDAVFIEVDNPNKVYVIASAAGQKVFWIAV
jgi:hypothetical protein